MRRDTRKCLPMCAALYVLADELPERTLLFRVRSFANAGQHHTVRFNEDGTLTCTCGYPIQNSGIYLCIHIVACAKAYGYQPESFIPWQYTYWAQLHLYTRALAPARLGGGGLAQFDSTVRACVCARVRAQCVHACVHACVRACARVCASACVRACVRARVRTCLRARVRA